MNAPPVFDADGKPYPRPDEEELIIHGWITWARLMFVHKGKMFALVAALSSGCTVLGYRYIGPTQDIQIVDRKVDTLTARVVRVEQNVAAGAADRTEIKESLDWLIYMQCRQQRRADPTDTPPVCVPERKR